MNKPQISVDVQVEGYLTALLQAALIHNASVIELASMIFSAGAGLKESAQRRNIEQFKRIHKDYQKEYQRVIDEYEKAINEGKI